MAGFPDWKQFGKFMSDFRRWCRGQGIYLTVPDWYFLNGQSKTGMGYTENDWSLPRQFQPLIERQDIFVRSTWNKTPSIGWMFVPLIQYIYTAKLRLPPSNRYRKMYQTIKPGWQTSSALCASDLWRGDRLPLRHRRNKAHSDYGGCIFTKTTAPL